MSREFELHDYEEVDLLPEYDLSGLQPGAAYRPLDQGYTVTVHKTDGSTEVRVVGPCDDAVILEPDVKVYFPDSESVNNALRSIIALFPKQAKKSVARSTRSSAPKRGATSTQGGR
jgi:hypothetical protein